MSGHIYCQDVRNMIQKGQFILERKSGRFLTHTLNYTICHDIENAPILNYSLIKMISGKGNVVAQAPRNIYPVEIIDGKIKILGKLSWEKVCYALNNFPEFKKKFWII